MGGKPGCRKTVNVQVSVNLAGGLAGVASQGQTRSFDKSREAQPGSASAATPARNQDVRLVMERWGMISTQPRYIFRGRTLNIRRDDNHFRPRTVELGGTDYSRHTCLALSAGSHFTPGCGGVAAGSVASPGGAGSAGAGGRGIIAGPGGIGSEPVSGAGGEGGFSDGENFPRGLASG